MGFLSRIVADARAHAPVVSATAPAVERTQAPDTAEGWEVVEIPFSPGWAQTPLSPSPAAPPPSPPSPASPWGVERAATLPAVPPMAAAPRSAPHGAPGRDDRNAVPDPAARASGDRSGLPVAPSTSSPAPLATARAAMTSIGAPSTPQPLASPRTPFSAEPARSRNDEAASRQARAGVPDSLPVGSPEHTHARVDQRPAARATDDRDGPAREAPIVQIETAASPGARTEPTAPQATRAAAPAPTLPEPIPPAAPRATPDAHSNSHAPAPRVEVSPSARAIEPGRPERPSPMPEPVAAPQVHIGRLEVIVAAPSQPPARPAQRSSADLASRRYLRNA
jgi:ribonuclease E